MANRGRLTTREAVKRAADIKGTDANATIDDLIEAMSREIESRHRRWYIPRTLTRSYPWPGIGPSTTLWVHGDLLTVTALTTDNTATTIASPDYFLEPVNEGPPYDRIEIDQSSSATFSSSTTWQRAIAVTGTWGYLNETESVGTVVSGLASDATATTFVASDSSNIGVGDCLLIQSEQVFVTDRASIDLAVNTTGALTASMSDTTLSLAAPTDNLVVGELIRIDSERMLVVDVNSATSVVVDRAYDGSTLASHNSGADVFTYRQYTIERGVNGTTAAVHANATAVSRQVVPRDVEILCRAEVISAFYQEQAGWGREIGAGDGAQEFSGRALANMRKRVDAKYRRLILEVA
jgi:hypothetical protein